MSLPTTVGQIQGIEKLLVTPLTGTELTNTIARLTYELGVIRLTAARAGYLDELSAANLPADIDTIKDQTGKLAGAAPTASSTTANWQTAEATLCTVGANDVKNKVHALWIDLTNLIGNITIHFTMQINGNARLIPDLTRVVTNAVNGPGCRLITGTLAIHEAMIVSLVSDNATDNAKAVAYDFMLEVM